MSTQMKCTRLGRLNTASGGLARRYKFGNDLPLRSGSSLLSADHRIHC